MIIQKNSVKAIIINNDEVLLIRKAYEDGSVCYTLPGGTQEPGELLPETLVREVFEETGANITPSGLIHVYEHQRTSRKAPSQIRHKTEFAFLAEIIEPYQPHNGEQPDSHQVAVEWVKIVSLESFTTSPNYLFVILSQLSETSHPVYFTNC